MSASELRAHMACRARAGGTTLAGVAWGVALACVPALAPAQSPQPVVTDADIARAARNQPIITDKDIERAARKHRMPTDAELARVPVPATPRIDALPQPLTPRRIDLGAIARGFEVMGQPTPVGPGLKAGPALLVFVSFSMPELALSRLVDQAARSGATIVLRGFVDGSLQQTVTRAQRLIGQRQVGFQIDPQAFDRFSVAVVPTFVLLKDRAAATPCAAGTCYPSASFVATAGDVSIDYALEFIKRSAPAFGRDASIFLSRMKGG